MFHKNEHFAQNSRLNLWNQHFIARKINASTKAPEDDEQKQTTERQKKFEKFEADAKLRNSPEKATKEKKEEAIARVEGAEKNAFDYVRGLFQEGGTLENADKNAINREVTKIAKERLGEFEKQLARTKVKGVQDLYRIAEKADRTLVLTQMKAKVLDEITADFETRLNQLRERKDAYTSLKETLTNRFTAGYALKKADLVRSRLIAVKGTVARDIANIKNRQEIKEVEQWDSKLRGILIRGESPKVTAALDELLIENAAGNPAKLEKAISDMVKEKRITPVEADTARSYAKALRTGLRRWYRWSGAGTNDIAGFYANRIVKTHESQEGDEKDPKKLLDLRMQRIKKAKTGQWVTLRVNGESKARDYNVSSNKDGRVFLTGRNGETPAMITTNKDKDEKYYVTMRRNKEIKEYSLNAPTRSIDPTRITFGTDA